jgi:hypothetical protein
LHELTPHQDCGEDKVDERSPQINTGEWRKEEFSSLEKIMMAVAGPAVRRAGEDAHCSECTKYGNVFDIV